MRIFFLLCRNALCLPREVLESREHVSPSTPGCTMSYLQVGDTSVRDLWFKIYTDDEIKQLSVLRISEDQSINDLGHLVDNGVYDLHMGPMSDQLRSVQVCKTCGQEGGNCQGHCGHIDLQLPVYNPFFYDVFKKLLKLICSSCFRFQADEHQVITLIYQTKLLSEGYGHEALEVQDIVTQIMAKTEEALEVTTGVNDREIKGSEKNYEKKGFLLTIDEILKQYLKDVIEGRTCCNETSTSNIKAIQDSIIKKFFQSCGGKKLCKFCNEAVLKLSFQNSRFMKASSASLKGNKKKGKEKDDDKDNDKDGDNDDANVSNKLVVDGQTYITSEQARTILRKCWAVDKELLRCLYPTLASSKLEYPTDMFFITSLLVIPPRYRPCAKRDGMTVEHESSTVLKKIVGLSRLLRVLLSIMQEPNTELSDVIKYSISEVPGETHVEKIQNVWYQMQGLIDNIFDARINSTVNVTSKGIRQVIETKRGLIRQNLMGKRVNYSARSVAAPDPLLAVDEVGVPMDFAIKLSYPVPVTPWNVEALRRLVKNGPLKYPGAVAVEDEMGRRQHLRVNDENQWNAIAKQLITSADGGIQKVNESKIVYRHLQDGDYVLMNRQPTLHRPSIQAHRARVMPNDRVLRMPYANCKAYNADFDGDELNLHFPQNELARSEAHHLITTHNQYLTPKDGSPLAGLIQDCVVASVMLTMRGKFFSKEDYQQLVYTGLSDHKERIKTLPPAIIKPKELWSGKQVISSLLHNIIPHNMALPSFTFKTSVKVDMWQTDKSREWKAGGLPEKRRETMTDSDFVIRDGELLSGVIDKSAIGSTSHGLVHTCYDLYGGSIASKLLTSINRLCVYYLKWAGHSISVKEFITPARVSARRRASLAHLVKRAPSEVSRKLGIAEETLEDYYEKSHMYNNEKDMAAIDAAYTSVLGPATSEVTRENEQGLLRRSLDNHMRMMVDTGAKGSKVNMNQMASLFGSVAIDGKRMPLSITGKSLPSFKAYDLNPRAGGYIPNRFMTGIDPQSYFFLCIVGRDSLQHTAVKTADSGYLQRCLIKHLEGIHVKYDMTVRNSDGLVLQFDYGEDGLDVTKVPFLKNPETLHVLVTNYSRLLTDRSLSIAKSVGDKELVDAYTEKLRKWHKKNRKRHSARRSGFLKFSKKMRNAVESSGFSAATGRANSSQELQDMWHNLTSEEKEKYSKNCQRCPDPANSVFSGASNLGVVSEALDDLINSYYDEMYSKHSPQLQKLTREQVATTVHMKALISKVDPGEAVGALCAQAIGEPLTQMTLNTFHFAGRDELNVTLGVPRMTEILRTASERISTPIMEVPFHKHISRSVAEALRIRLSEVSLLTLINGLNVNAALEKKRGQTYRRIKIKLTFLPHHEYKHMYAVNPSQVLNYVELHFIPKILLKELQKSFDKSHQLCSVTSDPDQIDAGDDKVNVDNDGLDAAEETMKSKAKLKATYSNDSEDDDDDDDDEDGVEANEDDAVDSSRKKKRQEQDYSENEEESEDEDNISQGECVSEDEGLGEEAGSDEELMQGPKVENIRKRKNCITLQEFMRRKAAVLGLNSWIVDYDFDRDEELWCEVTCILPVSGGNYDIPTIIRQKSERALIHYVPNIRRVFVVEKGDTLLLRTEGVNVLKMFEYENLLDVNRLYTNNIHQVAGMYGIEAAERSIIKELRAVQSAYDIKVDFRHLSLLADYFTCEGVYKACSRYALASCLSPLQKMSFETSIPFLKTAILRGEEDRMASPSANVALGQPVKLGTNSMHTLEVIRF
ncbi:DNA-directed RNA polymerase I subunit RPA1 isoform X2 [Procambarus clarkii]|uniref:DNA-directed RNA polymerase I subunit RPA1 isoform X2 n=1 Tax=Procambarus clarkii TaxID=6728 RepID=UPI001E6716CE|nr:DNA-directed RNA polymerase I subunit RPA1-like [Procambarus clarkii]